ncbi:MAG: methylisocitrate lyase [Phycisphaerae bacterium]|nr:methylisocitrate lyase [Phycisphaerae bacterium]
MTTPPREHAGTRLRSAMAAACVPLPGAFNALCGLAIRRAGFAGCYVSGAATSVSAGVPDVGILTLDHFVRTIREIADASALPILADADTGFGESEMVRRTVVEYERAGAAGLHLEDQVFPKRCGHLEGKRLIPVEHAAEKVAAAVETARSCSGGAFIVCARTDARGVEGFDAAIERARAYLAAGADMVFPEGLTSGDEFHRFASALRAAAPSCLLLANMTEFGKTPMIPLRRFAEMGYSCVIYPVSLLRVAMGAVTRALATLQKDGSVASLLPHMQTRQELYDLVGYAPGREWRFGRHDQP